MREKLGGKDFNMIYKSKCKGHVLYQVTKIDCSIFYTVICAII